VLMYMQEPEEVSATSAPDGVGAIAGRGASATLVVPAAATLVLGLFPGVIVGAIEKASVLRW
jgi:NADH:ubiquinone oxidoreductase subunit 2 (subunit N)